MAEAHPDFEYECLITTAIAKHWGDSQIRIAVLHFPEQEERYSFMIKKQEPN